MTTYNDRFGNIHERLTEQDYENIKALIASANVAKREAMSKVEVDETAIGDVAVAYGWLKVSEPVNGFIAPADTSSLTLEQRAHAIKEVQYFDSPEL